MFKIILCHDYFFFTARSVNAKCRYACRENFNAMYGHYSRQWQYLLPVLFLQLTSLCAATEYYVKLQNSSCPIDHCNTLDELAIKYDYARVSNIIVTNTTVYCLHGTHEVKRSIVVKEARNLTWVGIRTTTSGIRDVTINCSYVLECCKLECDLDYFYILWKGSSHKGTTNWCPNVFWCVQHPVGLGNCTEQHLWRYFRSQHHGKFIYRKLCVSK